MRVAAHPGLALYMFDSGTLGLDGVDAPIPFYLLRHPQGDVVVDGGNPLAVARDPHAHWGGLADIFEVHMTEEQHCAAQIERLGVDPASIATVVQTHLHIDHVGALGHFSNAAVVVHARELRAARAAEDPLTSGYVHADYDRPELRWQPIEGDHDLFGDGTIRMLETPGHSAGHMSLLIELKETGPVLLTADAADNRAQWDGHEPPRALSSPGDAARSLERLRELAKDTGALVVTGHDPEHWQRLIRAPECYR